MASLILALVISLEAAPQLDDGNEKNGSSTPPEVVRKRISVYNLNLRNYHQSQIQQDIP